MSLIAIILSINEQSYKKDQHVHYIYPLSIRCPIYSQLSGKRSSCVRLEMIKFTASISVIIATKMLLLIVTADRYNSVKYLHLHLLFLVLKVINLIHILLLLRMKF